MQRRSFNHSSQGSTRRWVKGALPWLLACGFTLPIAGAVLADDPPPSVTVTAGDPGDLDVGDQATAPASATINNPPKAANEGTLDQHWTWSISTGDSDTVYIEHPDASSTTYHCEHDDPGDYSIQVTASVTLHDPATNTDYGPYSGSDTFGDTDPDNTGSSSPTPMSATTSNPQPMGTSGAKHYPVTLHYRTDKNGAPTNYPSTGPTKFGHLTDWPLKATLTKTGKPFTKGMLQETQSSVTVNVKYSDPHKIPYFSGPGGVGAPVSHYDGTFEDYNGSYTTVDTSQPPYSDTFWYSFSQTWVNSGPNAAPDNGFRVVHRQPEADRTTVG